MKIKWAVFASVIVLAACGRNELDQILFEDQVFSGDIDFNKDDRTAFVTRGGPASMSLEGSRQVAVYRAVQHCLEYLGSSDIAWTSGPDVADENLLIQDGEIVLTGRCIEP